MPFDLLQPMDRRDVGMIQRSQHLRFALETGEPLGIVRERFWENFDGNIAPELGVLRLIDLSHSTCANRCGDLVRSELCARCDRHFFSPAVQLRHDRDGSGCGFSTAVDSGRGIRNRCPSGETA